MLGCSSCIQSHGPPEWAVPRCSLSLQIIGLDWFGYYTLYIPYPICKLT